MYLLYVSMCIDTLQMNLLSITVLIVKQLSTELVKYSL